MKKIKKTIKLIFNLLGLEIMKWSPNLALDLLVKDLIQRHEIDLILDVGANNGQFGLMLREIGYKGKIISFEPTKSAYEKLLLTSENDSNWRCINSAAGMKAEKKEINVYSSSLFSSFYKPSCYGADTFEKELGKFTTEIVDVVTLNDFLNALRDGHKNIFLKMDTQGHDVSVFKGANLHYKKIKLLLSEISISQIYNGMPSYRDALAEFENHNYFLAGLFPMNFNRDGSLVEMDALLVKRKAQ